MNQCLVFLTAYALALMLVPAALLASRAVVLHIQHREYQASLISGNDLHYARPVGPEPVVTIGELKLIEDQEYALERGD